MEKRLDEILVTILGEIHAAETSQSLFCILERACTALGFDAFVLSSHRPSKKEMALNPLYTTNPQEFRNNYEQLNWVDDDVHVARAIGSSHGFAWDSSLDRYSNVRSQSFLEFLHANSLACGVMVPLPHKPGHASCMALNSSRPMTLGTALVEAARLTAVASQAKAEMLGLCSSISADEAIGMRLLSGRQLEILNWIADGKSNADIATIMNLRHRAVHYHVGQILQKLCVATRLQAAQIFFVRSDHQFPSKP